VSSIPVDRLQDKTNIGFQLKSFDSREIRHKKSDDPGAHRDDHYIFFLITDGTGSVMVDFEEITIHANQLYYILPEQVHYKIKITAQAIGWFIAVDPSLINPECRTAFENYSGFHQPVTLTGSDAAGYDNLLNIIYGKIKDSSHGEVNVNVLHALLRAFLEMAASTVRIPTNLEVSSSRAAELSMNFKKLLNENIRKYKRPSEYANMLCVSEPYLNDCLKKTTGSSVSFWINYKIIIEAKRLLYFSRLNVKQIAHDLNFKNHSYFSRFFCKETGLTPLAFRKQYKNPNSMM